VSLPGLATAYPELWIKSCRAMFYHLDKITISGLPVIESEVLKQNNKLFP
jgi:hypothetical protein